MMEKRLLELEDFLFDFYGEENIKLIISVAASILGVLIGIKPTALLVNEVMEDGRMLLDNGSLLNILEELRLKIVISDVSRFTPPTNIKKTLNSLYKGNEFLYISRDTKLCYELMENYSVVTGLMKNGMVAEKDRKWNEANISVGKLLGYPETAVLEYVKMFGDLS